MSHLVFLLRICKLCKTGKTWVATNLYFNYLTKTQFILNCVQHFWWRVISIKNVRAPPPPPSPYLTEILGIWQQFFLCRESQENWRFADVVAVLSQDPFWYHQPLRIRWDEKKIEFCSVMQLCIKSTALHECRGKRSSPKTRLIPSFTSTDTYFQFTLKAQHLWTAKDIKH